MRLPMLRELAQAFMLLPVLREAFETMREPLGPALQGHHHDDHVHFVCTNCNKTICLDDIVSPNIELPEGYLAQNVQVVINGVCRECGR